MAIAILLASSFKHCIALGIILTLVPFYGLSLGASPLDIGILMSLCPLMKCFAPIVWGNVGDRFGYRTALLCNFTSVTLCYIAFNWVSTLSMLFVIQILLGAALSARSLMQSYIVERTENEERTRNLGFVEATGALGHVIGAAIVGVLVGGNPSNLNFHPPILAAIAISGANVGLASIALPRSTPSILPSTDKSHFSPQQFFFDVKKNLQRPLIGKVMILVFITFFTINGAIAMFAPWCQTRFGWGPQEFSYCIAFYFFAIAAMQMSLTGWLARWLGEVRLLLLGEIALTLGLFFLSFSTTVPQFIYTLLFLVFGHATCIIAFASLLSQLCGVQQQGKTLGLAISVLNFAGFLGSIGAGFLFDVLGENWHYWMGAALESIGTVFCWREINPSRFSNLMSDRRHQKLMHLFDIFDRNKNGAIERQDFQQAGQSLAELRGLQPRTFEYDRLQASLMGLWEILRRLADRDGDRQIDRQEWLSYLERDVDDDFINLFINIIDTNRDGCLTLDELETFYQAYNINTDEIEKVFHILDVNQNHYISDVEWREIFSQFLYSHDVQARGNWMFGTSLPKQL
ncbi:MAG: MFS transporter [Cyanobacteria bacterium SBLK]|nr:MFS transporter [Cyanobacteria bacterium SBLK]